jgi:hypothetical protein
LDSTTSLILAKKHCVLVIVPPLPRYMFGGCCKLAEHCANVMKPKHASKLLGEVIDLRNCLKKHVAGLGIGNCRVLDTCRVTDCIPTADLQTRVGALRAVTAKGSIHFLGTGYNHLVRHVMHTPDQPNTNAKQPMEAKKHYWRGFRSPVGANALAGNFRGGHAHTRAYRTMQHHPYRRN